MEHSSETAATGAAPAQPDLRGPFPVGQYATGLARWLRGRPRLLLVGEVLNLSRGRGGHAYFELRDADGGVPCAMWASDMEAMRLPEGGLRDGAQVVVAGGPDFYPGGRAAAPRFSFRVSYLRLAGEGDLLAKLERLRRQLHGEGLFEPQKLLPRPALPRTIGVVTGQAGKAREDLMAGFERRGWRGTVVWAFAPVQDSHAAPRIAEAIADLASLSEVEVIVVCRGGGSLTDLWAFCDEGLCRRVALLGTPVISAVGHHTDRTLIDDVAAVACSTPTHAAEAAVPLDCDRERAEKLLSALALRRAASAAVSTRGRRLAAMARTPAAQLRGHRARLHQQLREMRAAATRGLRERHELGHRIGAVVLPRKAASAGVALARERRRSLRTAADLRRNAEDAVARVRASLERVELVLGLHDPGRILERGYALVTDQEARPVTSAVGARAAGRVGLRFSDGTVPARIEGE